MAENASLLEGLASHTIRLAVAKSTFGLELTASRTGFDNPVTRKSPALFFLLHVHLD